MTLNITKPDGFRVIGDVTIEDGIVKSSHGAGHGDATLRMMRGWTEASVREYCEKCDWIVTVVETDMGRTPE